MSHHEHHKGSRSLEERCAAAGLKMTGQRKVILKVLDDAEDHPSVEVVYDRARAIDPSISMATVYRTLNLLDELELSCDESIELCCLSLLSTTSGISPLESRT